MRRALKLLFCKVDQLQEGGPRVPIFAQYQGRIYKRNWVHKNANYCELCGEPIGVWVQHYGKKDHSLMDAMYSALVDFPRTWNAQILLQSYTRQLGIDIGSLQKKYSEAEGKRRSELHVLVERLADYGVVDLGDPRRTYLRNMCGSVLGMYIQGDLVLREYLLPPLMRLFPYAGIAIYSDFVDFIVCAYNLETVYDLCGFGHLDALQRGPVTATSPQAQGFGGLATSHNVAMTRSLQSSSSADESSAAAAAEEAFSRKAIFVRSLLGQLRWVITEHREHPTGRVIAPHVEVMAELCCRYIVAELIACRLVEYTVRCEPVWRNNGMERKKLDVAERVKSGGSSTPALPPHALYRETMDYGQDLYELPREPTPSTHHPPHPPASR